MIRKKFRKLRKSLSALVRLEFLPRDQHQPARKKVRLQHSEALPQQPTGPVAFHCQQTVLLRAYHAASQFAAGRHHGHKPRSRRFPAVLADLIELGLADEFVAFSERQTPAAVISLQSNEPADALQAVSFARPF